MVGWSQAWRIDRLKKITPIKNIGYPLCFYLLPPQLWLHQTWAWSPKLWSWSEAEVFIKSWSWSRSYDFLKTWSWSFSKVTKLKPKLWVFETTKLKPKLWPQISLNRNSFKPMSGLWNGSICHMGRYVSKIIILFF